MRIDRGQQNVTYSLKLEEKTRLDQTGEAAIIIMGNIKNLSNGCVITLNNDGDRGYLPRAFESITKRLKFKRTGAKYLPPRKFFDGTSIE